MYEAFYGFQENPFRLTPDPHYLFLSTNHQEALGHLLFGVSEGNGVVVLTGEIGAGKTTLLRTVVNDLDEHTTVAYIFNPALSDVELLQSINADLGLSADSTSKKDLTDELNRFLLAQQAAARRVVVLVDEAQDLEPSVLEQLRLLSNLETEREKLLHIILVGQPELREILARPELAQLDQRVTLRWHLGPLTAKETAVYVRHRIRIAGEGRETMLFSPASLRQVYRFSRGIPRLINILCHRALLVGYTREEALIRPKVIRQAIWELRRHTTGGPGFRWSLATVSTALVFGGLLVAWGTADLPSAWDRLGFNRPDVAASPHATEQTLPVAESVQKTEDTEDAGDAASAMDTGRAAQERRAPEQQGEIKAQQGADAAVTQVEAASDSQVTDVAAVDRLASSPQELFDALQQDDMLPSAVRATQQLIAAWQQSPLKKAEWQGGNLDLAAIAAARQLEYLPVAGDIRLLTLLDLPVMVGLTIPLSGQTRFALVRQMSETHCLVQLEQDYIVPLEAVTHNWFREAHVFWRNYEKIRMTLAQGHAGLSVEKLQTLLAKVPVPSDIGTLLRLQAGHPTQFFGPQTQAAVARFQTMQQLEADGIVGPQTLILLYNRLPTYMPPSLSRREMVLSPFAARPVTTGVPKKPRAQVDQPSQAEQVGQVTLLEKDA